MVDLHREHLEVGGRVGAHVEWGLCNIMTYYAPYKPADGTLTWVFTQFSGLATTISTLPNFGLSHQCVFCIHGFDPFPVCWILPWITIGIVFTFIKSAQGSHMLCIRGFITPSRLLQSSNTGNSFCKKSPYRKLFFTDNCVFFVGHLSCKLFL